VGGGELAAALGEHGLFTEYIVSVIATILGASALHFAGKGSRERLRLVDSRSYPTAIVPLR
jgi:dihydrofolate reductase